MSGKTLEEFPAPLNLGTHEILYTHGYNFTTPLIYALEVDGQIIAQNRMIFVYLNCSLSEAERNGRSLCLSPSTSLREYVLLK